MPEYMQGFSLKTGYIFFRREGISRQTDGIFPTVLLQLIARKSLAEDL